jgi:hypothetical protein
MLAWAEINMLDVHNLLNYDIRTLSYSLLFTYCKVHHPCLPYPEVHNQC